MKSKKEINSKNLKKCEKLEKMKSVKTEKFESNEKWFNEKTGRLNKIVIISFYIQFFLFLFIYKIAFLCYFKIIQINTLKDILYLEKLVNNIINKLILSYQDFFINITKIEFMNDLFLFVLPEFFLFLLVFYTIFKIEQAKKAMIMSNLSLDSYTLKPLKNGLLLKLKDGEEMNFKYVQSIKSDIKQAFNINKNISIERANKTDILIEFVDELQNYHISLKYLKKGQIFFGIDSTNTPIYVPILGATHYLMGGQSGSGKSVFQNLLIANFLFNINEFKALYLVDLKGGVVEFGRYAKFDKVSVIGELIELLHLTNELIEEMNNRYDEMSKIGITKKKDEPIFLMIDEFASIKDMKLTIDKEEFKQLELNIRTLLAKARASNIKIFVASQRLTADSIDTTVRSNFQSKILMKSDNKDSQRAVFGDLDWINEMGLKVDKFQKGEYVFKDDFNQDIYHLKAPFVPDDFYLSLKAKLKEKTEQEVKAEPYPVIKDKSDDKEVAIDKKELKIEIDEDKEALSSLDLDKEIAKRKDLYNLTKKIEDDKKRKEIYKEIRAVKKLQENNISCIKELKEIEAVLTLTN
jgi:hypothetical protein